MSQGPRSCLELCNLVGWNDSILGISCSRYLPRLGETSTAQPAACLTSNKETVASPVAPGHHQPATLWLFGNESMDCWQTLCGFPYAPFKSNQGTTETLPTQVKAASCLRPNANRSRCMFARLGQRGCPKRCARTTLGTTNPAKGVERPRSCQNTVYKAPTMAGATASCILLIWELWSYNYSENCKP